MHRRDWLFSAASAIVAGPVFAQAPVRLAPEGSVVAGKWTYRSFHNRAALVGDDPQKALDLIFAEAVFTFDVTGTACKGAIDWPGGGLDLQGTVQPARGEAPLSVVIVGTGRPNSPTAGWQYDYRADLAYHWPNGVDQVPALVGTVVRAKPHGAAPAGYVASFIAVKQS
jgi:hypothetical protein